MTPLGAGLEFFDPGVAARAFDRDDFEQIPTSAGNGPKRSISFAAKPSLHSA